MATLTVSRAAEQVRMRWKNGLGTTLEVARWDDPGGGEMLWRVSIADVATDGPFSLFGGYRRIISVLDGEGMALTVDGVRSRVLRQYDPFAFDGGARTSCELVDGPIRDFNLIADERVPARMRWTRLAGNAEATGAARWVLVYNAGTGTLLVRADGDDAPGAAAARLMPGDCAQAQQEALLLEAADGDCACAIVEVGVPG